MSLANRFYGAEQVGAMFGKSPQWATRMAREGEFPFEVVRVGHRWFFPREDVDAMVGRVNDTVDRLIERVASDQARANG